MIYSTGEIILIYLGMMVVTYIPRMLPLTILSRVTLPDYIIEFLGYIPAAILGALLLPTLLYVNNELNITISNYYLIAGILTMIIAILTKKLYITVLSGIAIMWLIVSVLT